MASKIRALVIHTDGTVAAIELVPDDPNSDEPTYVRDIQQAVGGYFEHVGIRPDMDMWVHEMGAYLLPPNPVASLLTSLLMGGSMHIFGPVVVTGGDDGDGGTLGIGEHSEAVVTDYSKMLNGAVKEVVADNIHDWAVRALGRPVTAPKRWEA